MPLREYSIRLNIARLEFDIEIQTEDRANRLRIRRCLTPKPVDSRRSYRHRTGVRHMLYYSLAFLVIALIAAVLGFGGIAGSAVGIAKILFFVFLVMFVVSLFLGRRGRV